MLSVVGKIYAGIFVNRVCRVTAVGLIDDEEGGFREGRGCVDQIFTLNQIGEKECGVYVGFIDFKKTYARVNREALWLNYWFSKLLGEIKSTYVDSLACVRVKGV